MGNFRKKPVKCFLCGGSPFIERVENIVLSSGEEQRKLVKDLAKNFITESPPIDVFTLENKIKAGVKLNEVDSVVFTNDSLSDSEISQLEKVIDDDTLEENLEEVIENNV